MKRAGLTIILTIVVIALLGAVGYTYLNRQGSISSGGVLKDKGSNISDYSSVFLTNGQVYFGKINSDSNDKTLDLTDIYYLQVNQQIQPDQKNGTTSTTQANQQPSVVLVKLGQELHGPNDRMQINRSQIVFTESLKNDSKVVSAIKDYQSKNPGK